MSNSSAQPRINSANHPAHCARHTAFAQITDPAHARDLPFDRSRKCAILATVFVVALSGIGALVCVPGAHAATTFYVDNSCTVNGNGRSTTCGPNGPWNSLTAAQFCDHMGPGDTIEIRAGTGVYNEGDFASMRPDAVLCSGTAEAPIVIQNYPGEDVLIDGTEDIRASTWVLIGSGVYQCTAGVCGTHEKFPFTAWYDRGAGEERLDLIQSNQVCDATLPPGQMRYIQFATGGQVCVHLSDGSSPAASRYFRIPSIGAAFALDTAPGVKYLTLRKNPLGGSVTVHRFRDYGIIAAADLNIGIRLEGLDIGWVMDRCVSVDTAHGAGPHATLIANNHIHHCGQEGIHVGMDTSVTGIQILDNEIDHVQSEPVFERCAENCQATYTDDGTGIRWGALSTARAGAVSGNTIHDIGCARRGRVSGINMENGTNNSVIENNFIYNMRCAIAQNGGQAILISNSLNEGNTNTVIRNNRIFNVDDCFTFELNVDGSVVESINIFNNTCAEPFNSGITLKYSGVVSGAVNIANNLFVSTAAIEGQMIEVPPVGGFVTPVFNAFYCVGCDRLIEWQGLHYNAPELDTLGVGNVYGVPNINLAGSPPTLKILSPAGAAYHKGLNLYPPFRDFEGDMRPSIGAWDIGADKFTSPGPLPIPVRPGPVAVPPARR